MKFFLTPFQTPDSFSILPALTLRVMRCGNPGCETAHGYELGLHWFTWGIGAIFVFNDDDLT